jgi:hypothetical protein
VSLHMANERLLSSQPDLKYAATMRQNEAGVQSAESGGSGREKISRHPQPAHAGIEKADSTHASRHFTVLCYRVWFAIFNHRSALGQSHSTAATSANLDSNTHPTALPLFARSPVLHPVQRVPECGRPCSCWPWPWR